MVEALKKTQLFLEECWTELSKVVWPDSAQLRNATLVIILFVIGVSGVIWVMDITVSAILDFVMGIFGA